MRDIMRHTGADVKSWTEQHPGGGGGGGGHSHHRGSARRPCRVFLLSVRRRVFFFVVAFATGGGGAPPPPCCAVPTKTQHTHPTHQQTNKQKIKTNRATSAASRRPCISSPPPSTATRCALCVRPAFARGGRDVCTACCFASTALFFRPPTTSERDPPNQKNQQKNTTGAERGALRGAGGAARAARAGRRVQLPAAAEERGAVRGEPEGHAPDAAQVSYGEWFVLLFVCCFGGCRRRAFR